MKTIIVLGFIVFLILPACTVTPYITNTKKSTVEQLLVSKALDDALMRVSLDIKGVKVYIDVASLTWDEDGYIKKALTHWFLRNGALITEFHGEANYTASILVKCAGTGGNQFFLGLPSIAIPLVNVSTPQLSAMSGYRQKGYAEFEIILYGPEGGLKEKTFPLKGKSYFNEYTILFIPFSSENIY